MELCGVVDAAAIDATLAVARGNPAFSGVIVAFAVLQTLTFSRTKLGTTFLSETSDMNGPGPTYIDGSIGDEDGLATI